MTALVDALEADGLVERRRHPTDGRSTIVALTAKGLAQQKASWGQQRAEISRAFGDLSPAHQRQLLEITPLLTDALRRRAAERPDLDGDRRELPPSTSSTAGRSPQRVEARG